MNKQHEGPALHQLQEHNVNGHKQFRNENGQFVAHSVAANAKQAAEGALLHTVAELGQYGHDVSKADYIKMAGELGLDQKYMKFVGASALQSFDKDSLAADVANSRALTGDDAENLQHNSRQAEYDAMAKEVGPETEDQRDHRVKLYTHNKAYNEETEARVLKREREQEEIADSNLEIDSHNAEINEKIAKREEIMNADNLDDKTVSELAALVGEKPNYKKSKSDYVRQVRETQETVKDVDLKSELLERAEWKPITVDMATPANRAPSDVQTETVEILKRFQKGDMSGETRVIDLTESAFNNDLNDLLDILEEREQNGQLSPERHLEMIELARLVQSQSEVIDTVTGKSPEVVDNNTRELAEYFSDIDVSSSKSELAQSEENYNAYVERYMSLVSSRKGGTLNPEVAPLIDVYYDLILKTSQHIGELEGLSPEKAAVDLERLRVLLDIKAADEVEPKLAVNVPRVEPTIVPASADKLGSVNDTKIMYPADWDTFIGRFSKDDKKAFSELSPEQQLDFYERQTIVSAPTTDQPIKMGKLAYLRGRVKSNAALNKIARAADKVVGAKATTGTLGRLARLKAQAQGRRI